MLRCSRPQLYRGFRLTILNNKTYSFKYEYHVEAVTQTAKALLQRNWGKDKTLIVRDPTSSRTISYAKDRGRVKINELCSPFWYKDWHYA